MGRMASHGVPAATAQIAVAAVSLALLPTGRATAMQRCPDAHLRPTASNLPRVEKAMVCLLNLERAGEDRDRVTRDARLDRSATRHTEDMASRGYFAHAHRDGPTLLERVTRARYFEGARAGLYSENLGFAAPERATAAGMTHAFALSESHRRTMLYGRFRNVGIGSKIVDPQPAFYPDYSAVVFAIDFGRRYERRRRCRHAGAGDPRTGDSTSSTATTPRRWCRKEAAK